MFDMAKENEQNICSGLIEFSSGVTQNMSVVTDPLISTPCLTDFADEDDDFMNLLGGVTGSVYSKSSPGHESVDSGSADLDIPIFSPSASDNSEFGDSEGSNYSPQHFFSDNLYSDLSTVSLVDTMDDEQDSDLLNYIVNTTGVLGNENNEITIHDIENTGVSDPDIDVVSTSPQVDENTESNVRITRSKQKSTVSAQSDVKPCRIEVKPCQVVMKRVSSATAPLTGTSSRKVEQLLVSTRPTGKQTNSRVIKLVKVPPKAPEMLSVDEAFESLQKKSMKNAEQARINRQKKKQYIAGLEEQVSYLQKENSQLKSSSSKLQRKKSALEDEVAYLRNVLANESALSGLLKNIGNTQGVSLKSSFSTNLKRSNEHDHDYDKPAKRACREEHGSRNTRGHGGVCLHVDQDAISLEFCSQCAKMASTGKK